MILTAYLDALPPHVRRPVMLVLFYGLRSTAVCALTLDSLDGNFLVAIDKGGVRRRIPIDEVLAGIVLDAQVWRDQAGARGDALLVNSQGRPWTRATLLRAAQRSWRSAGLPQKKIHEVRHTLGTIAGASFAPGVVQALMGHRSRRSSEAYFHPTEAMAAEARQKIVTELSQKNEKVGKNKARDSKAIIVKNGVFSCPCCGVSLYLPKRKPTNR